MLRGAFILSVGVTAAAVFGGGCNGGSGALDAGPDASGFEGGVRGTHPQASDLAGAWYAVYPPRDGGAPPERRVRFFDGRYAMVFGSRTGYCGESGTFSLSNGTLSLRPDARAGRGQCVQAASRTENLAWNDDGIVFQVALAGGAEPVLHRRARHVPKVFATVESHDGNWAGDATLPGTTAIEKADGFCERSLARPDGQSYKAMLTDGTTRTGSPAVEWILKPDTTYFQADGVLNVFRTDRMALSRTTTNHPVLNNMNVSYYWSGLSFEFGASSSNCNQWTSASDTVVGVLADASQEVFTFTSSVVTGCARQDNGLICISQ